MLNAVITDGRQDLHLAFFRHQGYQRMLQSAVSACSAARSDCVPRAVAAGPSAVSCRRRALDDPEEVEAFHTTINPIYPATCLLAGGCR